MTRLTKGQWGGSHSKAPTETVCSDYWLAIPLPLYQGGIAVHHLKGRDDLTASYELQLLSDYLSDDFLLFCICIPIPRFVPNWEKRLVVDIQHDF